MSPRLCDADALAEQLARDIGSVPLASGGRVTDLLDPISIRNIALQITEGDNAVARRLAAAASAFNFVAHLRRQRDWSEQTFGPGTRAAGVVDHIRKELREIEADPADLKEWIDVVILALDGAWRSGAAPEQIVAALVAKQTRNEARQWPDWRTMPADKAIEHVRAGE